MNNNSEMLAVEESCSNKRGAQSRTTIGLRITTKDKLDRNRAPGQCYDGFIWQLVNMWERNNGK